MLKIITFSLPSSLNNSVVVEEDIAPYMFSHLHKHEEMQITLILRGEGTVLIGDKPFDYAPSTAFLVKGDVPHVFKSRQEYLYGDNPNAIHAIHIYFNYKRIIGHLKHLPEFTNIRMVMDRLDNGLLINIENQPFIPEKIRAIQQTVGVDRFIKFVSLLNYICERPGVHHHIVFSNFSVSYDIQDGAKWNKVYRYVLAHYTDSISLRDIAEIANLTPQAFCKYFKKRTRKTFSSFLNEIRIKEAISQMTGEDFLGISQTAYSTGFKSAVHFNRTFKKVTGSSPTGYLRHHQAIQRRFVE